MYCADLAWKLPQFTEFTSKPAFMESFALLSPSGLSIHRLELHLKSGFPLYSQEEKAKYLRSQAARLEKKNEPFRKCIYTKMVLAPSPVELAGLTGIWPCDSFSASQKPHFC